MKGLLGRSTAVLLAACLFFQGIGENTANAAAEPEKASDHTETNTTEETVLFEEGFESGQIGRWSGRVGAELSVVTEDPNSGSYCMKISGRTAPASGAELKVGSMLQGNQRLQISAYAKYTQGPDSKRVQITMYYDGKYYIIGGKELTRGEWGAITGSMVISEELDMSEAVLFLETPWAPEPSAGQDLMDIYVDDVKVTVRSFSDISNYPSLKELYKHQFLVGVAVPDNVLNTPVYSKLVDQQFNSMTMENEMKPGYILDEGTSKGNLEKYQEHAALNFNSCKTGMEYAKKHGIAMRGHTLIWHSQTPDWFFYKDYDVSGKLADRELMLKRMENYIKDVIEWTETNYPGVIYAWDVVNEAIADYYGEGAAPMRESLWYQVIGADFVQKAFEYARKYTRQYAKDREIKLIYNDFNEYFPARRDGIVAMLKPIQEAGNIDGMGMQSHFDTSWPLEGEAGYMTAIRTFRDELGIEIHVTELDIGIAEGDTEKSQGVYFQEFMEALLKEKRDGAKITSVTLWGLSDDLSWRADDHCLLFKDDLSRKPAFDGVVNAIGDTGAVIDAISAIKTVELTEECKADIDAARNAYEALTENQKKLVSDDILKILEDAETEYQRQEEERRLQLLDQKAAEEVIAKIRVIGEIEVTPECKARIEAAKEAYEKLTAAQKELVTNAADLDAAEAKYQELLDQSEKPVKADIRRASVSVISPQTYCGKALEPSITVIDDGKELIENTDYTVSYSNNVNVGTAQVEITGKRNYTGSICKTFTIEARNIAEVSVKPIPAQNYNKKERKPSVTVIDGGKKLVKDIDYTVRYSKNKNIGTAQVEIIGKGNYTNSIRKTFVITVKKNAVYTVGKYKYKITSAKTNGTGTVAVTGVKSSAFKKNLKTINVSSTVNIGGKKFKVTEIGNNAFSGCSKVTSTTIGANVTKIGSKTFYNCRKLKKITIKSTKLKSVGKNAIKGIYKKAVIKCPSKKLKNYKKLFKVSSGYKKTMKIQ